jgi:hypothetical protein
MLKERDPFESGVIYRVNKAPITNELIDLR